MLCSTHKNGRFGACHVFFDSKGTTPTPHTVLVTCPFDCVGEAGIIRATARIGASGRDSGHALVFNVAIAGFVLQGETEVTVKGGHRRRRRRRRRQCFGPPNFLFIQRNNLSNYVCDLPD